MKRLLFLIGLLILLARPAPTTTVMAHPPYTTWALGPGGRLYLTQDAYIPLRQITLPVKSPEDLFITPEGVVYVADTGGRRVVRLNNNWEVEAEYGRDLLTAPTGLWVDSAGTIYVADAGRKMVVLLDREGKLLAQYGRPVEPLFGKDNQFLPRKIAVDARQNLYIVSEGSTAGLVMMNTRGNFIGYFGANPATMSLKMILQRMFLTEEQLAQFIKNEAASPSNVTIDHQSMIFTVTAGTVPSRSIRRFTVSGRNIFPEILGSSTFRDLHVSKDGLVIAVDAEGRIYEYELTGMLLFVFGAKDQGDQRLGLLSNPTAIERYGNIVYVLDKDKNAVILYQATDFAKTVHQGVRLYVEGYYTDAKPYFEQVLHYNGSFIMAYQAIADAYFKEGDYARALVNYRHAEDRIGYSEAFWELRNVLLQHYLGSALLLLFGLALVQGTVKWLDRRSGWLAPWRQRIASLKQHKLVDDFLFLFRFIKQPADSFYYIKKDQRGSLRFALLLYFWVVVTRIASLYLTSFIFNPYANLSEIPVEQEIVYLLLFFFLWNSANYLISTIRDGEGRVRDVVIGTAYALFPYALFGLPIALFSNLLSLNEVFLYTFSLNLVYAWTGLMLFIMVKEVHNYPFGETVRNILLTLFTMALMILTGYILYVLFFQLFDFFSTLWSELQLRS